MKAPTPVKIAIIREIFRNVLVNYYRLESFLHDHVEGTFPLSDVEKASLMDSLASALALKVLFEDYIEQAEQASVETLYIPYQEFKNILNMAKAVEASNNLVFNGVGIWAH